MATIFFFRHTHTILNMFYNEDYLIVNMKTRPKYLALNVVFCEHWAVNILSHLDLCVYVKSVADWAILKMALLILLALNRTLITQLVLLAVVVVVVLIIFKIAEFEYEIWM